jgi:hypothetical protein
VTGVQTCALPILDPLPESESMQSFKKSSKMAGIAGVYRK